MIRDASDGPFTPELNIRKLSRLLEIGFDILDVDDFGNTCLHLFFLMCTDVPRALDWATSLVYLVSQGADVQAVNSSGQTISDIAYQRHCNTYPSNLDVSFMRGDLWDLVLVASGHDLADFRSFFPRTASYGKNYTREHFERLWKGREEQCPYWDDLDWPPRDHNGSDSDSDSDIDSDKVATGTQRVCSCLADTCWFATLDDYLRAEIWSDKWRTAGPLD